MNKDQVAGKKDQFLGAVKEKWGKLTNDQIAQVEGNAQKFYGTVREQYGIGQEEAEKHINELRKKYDYASGSDTKAA